MKKSYLDISELHFFFASVWTLAMTTKYLSLVVENMSRHGEATRVEASVNSILRVMNTAAAKKTVRTGSLGGVALSLAACGGEDGLTVTTTPTTPSAPNPLPLPLPVPPSTGGTTPATPTTFNGVVIDGYIRDAMVFVDANGNGRQDIGEASTTTNSLGGYSLQSDAVGRLISVGGTDVSTNLPFNGTLFAPQGATVVNSLTTLVSSLVSAGQDPATAKATVASVLGLPSGIDITSFDPLLAVTDANATTAQRQAALETHKIAVNVAVILSQAGAIGGAPSSAGANATSTAASDALAALIRNTASGQRLDLTNTGTLDAVFSAIGTALGGADQARLDQVKSQLVTIMLQTNEAIERVPVDASNILNTLNSIAKAQVVAQGGASAAMSQAVQTGDATSAVAAFTGTALNAAINNAQAFVLANGVQAPITVVVPPVNPDLGPGSGPSTTPVNVAPTGVALNNQVVSLAENTTSTVAVKVADIAIIDDALGINTVTLTGADAVFFEVVGTELRLKAGTELDFEKKSSYDVTINVTDSSLAASAPVTANYTLSVTDVNDAPSVIRTATLAGTETITFGVFDPDSATLTARLGTTVVNLGAVVNGKDSITTLTLAEQQTTVQGELNVFDGAQSTSLGLFLSLGSAGADTLTTSGSLPAVLQGFGGDDVLTGGDGADTLVGGAGVDTLSGGAGNDTFAYAQLSDLFADNSIVDTIDGGDGTDSIRVDAAVTITKETDLSRASSVESIVQNATGGARVEINSSGKLGSIRIFDLSASTANSTVNLSGFSRTMSVTTGSGNDSIVGSFGNDVLNGGSGNDVFSGGVGADTLIGGDGDDVFTYVKLSDFRQNNAVVNSIDGGAGEDRIEVSGSITFTAADSLARITGVETFRQRDIASGPVFSANILIESDEKLGSIRNFDLRGSSLETSVIDFSRITKDVSVRIETGTNTISGGGGNDVLTSISGNNVFIGGAGVDTLTGGLGADSFEYASFTDLFANNAVIDSVNGGAGADRIRVNDAITVTSADSFARVVDVETLLQSASDAASVVISKDENLGSIHSLDLTASTAASAVNLSGVTQVMTVTTGSGNDTISGGSGADTLKGGAGGDTFAYAKFSDFFANSAVIDSIDGGEGADIIRVDESITLTAADNLSRVVGVETLVQAVVGAASVVIDQDANLGSVRALDFSASTAASTVTLSGLMQAMLVTTGSGSDTVTGGAGADTISSGEGSDVLFGGAGADVYDLGHNDSTVDTVTDNGSQITVDASFGITGFDVVKDFVKGQDDLVFSGTGGQTAVQLAGTFDNTTQSFMVGEASTDNDIIVFHDANKNGKPDANEHTIVVTEVKAGGQAVDLNGATAGNGYEVAVAALTAMADNLAMTDGASAKFSVATLMANDTGTNLSITGVSNPTGSISSVTYSAADKTVTVVSASNTSSTSGEVLAGSFEYSLSDGTITIIGTVNVDVYNSTTALFVVGQGLVQTGNDSIDLASENYVSSFISSLSGLDTVVGSYGNDTIIGGRGFDHLTGGDGADLFIFNSDDSERPFSVSSHDVIFDFSVSDRVAFLTVAGTAPSGTVENYREFEVLDISDLYSKSIAEFSNGSVKYVFGSMKASNAGFLIFSPESDLSGNQTIMIKLDGLTDLANFDHSNIIISPT